jgi:ribonucleoside-diphosphate reductase alpha chain
MARQHLPDERYGITHRFVIHSSQSGDAKGYLTVSLYDDGRPGEIFLKMDRVGGTLRGFADAWAISVSLLLQTGTPIWDIAEKFRGMTFDPMGRTDNPDIRVALSPIDYVARWLTLRFPRPEAA